MKIVNIFIFIFILSMCSIGVCETYYVSPRATYELNQTDEGIDAWEASKNISTPCSAETAMVHAIAGDTVLFLDGTYLLYHPWEQAYWFNGALEPENSGAQNSPIIFKALNKHLAILDVNSGSGADWFAHAFSFGCRNDYITIDGFKIIADGGNKLASIKVNGFDCDHECLGLKALNLDMYGGNTNHDNSDNFEAIFMRGTKNAEIANCRLYGYRHIDNWANTSSMKFYRCDSLSIHNCEIFDCSVGLHIKSRNSNVSIAYNFLHDNYEGGRVHIYIDANQDNIVMHDNVIVNNTKRSWSHDIGEEAHANDYVFYNNTVYGDNDIAFASARSQSGYGVKFFNNILINLSAGSKVTYEAGTTEGSVSGFISEADHNNLYSVLKMRAYSNGYKDYTSLASWQTSAELENPVDVGCGLNQNPGCGSLAVDPQFENASGNLNQLDDFRLATGSPCIGTGRGGVDMGADIDLVGVNPGSPPQADNTGSIVTGGTASISTGGTASIVVQ